MIPRVLRNLGLLAVTLGCSCTTPFAARSNQTGALIDAVIEAYGGRQHVLSVRAYRVAASMRAHSRGEDAAVIRVVEGPVHLKVLIRYPSGEEVRVLDGEKAWRGQSPQHLVSVGGPMRAAMVLQAARANLPWILETMRSQVRLAGTTDASPVLEVPLDEGLLLRAFVDAHTHRVMRTESVLTVGGMGTGFQTEYSDFRKVDGVLFPFHEENYASGVHTASTMVESIQVNPSKDGLDLPMSP